ncbi:MAG: hypothetical protein OXF83_02565 [Anaerolineaceae bacterium]|nr:hypothetical protein [Anaerolineaceae bacterium]
MTKGRIMNSERGTVSIAQVGMLVVGIVVAFLLLQAVIPLIVAVLIWSLAGWGAGKIVQGHGYDPITNIIYGFGGGIVSFFVFRILGIDLGEIPIVSDVLEGMVGAVLIIGARNWMTRGQTTT